MSFPPSVNEPNSGPDLDLALKSLRGVAVGDSLGLVYEGLSSRRGTRLYPLPPRQRLLFRRGFVSDDAVQSSLVVAALARHPRDIEAFQADFAGRLRAWFLSVPPGVGLSTARACAKLTIAFGPSRSGIRSAGNGAAMRSAVIGAAWAHDPASRIAFADACARVTHTHPLAIQGSQIVALAAALSATGRADEFDEQSGALSADWPWEAGWPARGPGGFVVPSVNAALYIWRQACGWRDAMKRVIELGGDTDTVGAMVGGILGAGDDRIPEEWGKRIIGHPGRRHEKSLRAGSSAPYGRLLAMNLLALPVVLFHGFRRLLPPY